MRFSQKSIKHNFLSFCGFAASLDLSPEAMYDEIREVVTSLAFAPSFRIQLIKNNAGAYSNQKSYTA